MKRYIAAGVVLCVVAFAIHAGWIPRPMSLEDAAPPPVAQAPVATDSNAAREPSVAPPPVPAAEGP